MKTRIVIASILKPVNDVRMYDKMAASLSKTGLYEVFIIGQAPGSVVHSHYNKVEFIPLFSFPRLSFSRIVAPIRFFIALFKLKPELVIINTNELILPAVLYKFLKGVPVVYDIRENYYLNIKNTGSYKTIIRPIIASLTRIQEKYLSKFITHFILAEKVYASQLPFATPHTIIENKALSSTNNIVRDSLAKKETIQFIFSGTIAEETGVFKAIQFVKRIFNIDKRVSLLIIGYTSRRGTYSQLLKKAAANPFIQLLGGYKWVSHDVITDSIHNSDVGIVSYIPNEHIKGKIPTKVFEYLSANLPIVLTSDQPGSEFVTQQNAGEIIPDFETEDELKIWWNAFLNNTFYTNKTIENIYWESDAFTNLINSMNKKS